MSVNVETTIVDAKEGCMYRLAQAVDAFLEEIRTFTPSNLVDQYDRICQFVDKSIQDVRANMKAGMSRMMGEKYCMGTFPMLFEAYWDRLVEFVGKDAVEAAYERTWSAGNSDEYAYPNVDKWIALQKEVTESLLALTTQNLIPRLKDVSKEKVVAQLATFVIRDFPAGGPIRAIAELPQKVHTLGVLVAEWETHHPGEHITDADVIAAVHQIKDE